jgi:hypothetical protein
MAGTQSPTKKSAYVLQPEHGAWRESSAEGFSRRPGGNRGCMSNARDVEKRWHDPPTLRKAVTYDAAVIAVAGIAFAIHLTVDKASLVLASSVPAILLLGGIGAFVKAYRVWRAGGTWPMWQGAGWFLLTLMLVYLSIPWSAAVLA